MRNLKILALLYEATREFEKSIYKLGEMLDYRAN